MTKMEDNTRFVQPLHNEDINSVADISSASAALSAMPRIKSPLDQSRDSSTIAAYQLRMKKQILPQVRQAFYDDSPTSITEWLVGKSPNLRPSSFRQYRAAIIHHIESTISTDFAVTAEAEETIQKLKSLKPARADTRRPHRTSSSKRKYIKPGELTALLGALSNLRKWGPVAASYLLATIAAGLRPSEWWDCSVKDVSDGIILSVRNKKNTNMRSTGEFRWMLIPDSMAGHIKKYLSIVSELKSNGADPEVSNKAIRRIVASQSKKLFGKDIHITPYTARHQFSANNKNVMTQPEVSMLHGHRSIKTATECYGKRRSGFEVFKMYRAKNKQALEKILNADIMNE